jgi:2-succinyl-6-hydroxy-2,4-cyclohexadiene-1-carboxylate synthase
LGEHRLHHAAHPGNGPFLLLVHGMLSGRSLWQPNLAALSAVSRPIVVELWGHGRSPSPDDPACYRPEAYVRAFEELRAELGAERWFVCGQSFGAALTLRYALDHPERVIAQVFTNSASALGDADWVARMRTALPALADEIERGRGAAIERMPIHPRHAQRIPAEYREAVLADAARVSPRGSRTPCATAYPYRACVRESARTACRPCSSAASGSSRSVLRGKPPSARCRASRSSAPMPATR